MSTPISVPVSKKNWLKRFWSLAKPFWTSEEKWPAIGLLVAVISLTLAIVFLGVQFNTWNRAFYRSLQAYDVHTFWRQILWFGFLAVCWIFVLVYQAYLQQMLAIRWRRWLTSHMVDRWLKDKTYYLWQLEQQMSDNPDQRISEDINSFVVLSLELSMGVIRETVNLVTFIVILWSVSGPLTVGGLTIPAYMVWACLLYALCGSWLIHKIGSPLIGLTYNQQRFEANFRFHLVRLRENAESVALSRGEKAENRTLMARFSDVYSNFWAIMNRQKQLIFTRALYNQLAIIFPMLVAAPRYFAKKIDLGELMQINNAFGEVRGSISYFIDAYLKIAEFAAVMLRLDGFLENVQAAQARAPRTTDHIHRNEFAAAGLTLKKVSLSLPGNVPLLDGVNFHVKPGESLLVSGPSGIGKSTLFRAIGGIWPYWEGKIEMPAGMHGMVVPQKPYLPVDTLRAALTYPELPTAYSEEEVLGLMALCKLQHLAKRLDDIENWSQVLSPGEQQRVAFVRVFLHKPDWLFLDEATSALDESMQKEVYEALKLRLPGLSVVSIAHRASLKEMHQREYNVETKEETALGAV